MSPRLEGGGGPYRDFSYVGEPWEGKFQEPLEFPGDSPGEEPSPSLPGPRR